MYNFTYGSGQFFFSRARVLKGSPGRWWLAGAPGSFSLDAGGKVLAFGAYFDFWSQPEVTGKNYRHENFDKIK